jgi:DNA-binding MarR family transcriptional regulator
MKMDRIDFFADFVKIEKKFRKMVLKLVNDRKFTKNEILVLMYLAENETENTARDISNYLNLSKSLIAKSVDSLCKRGYMTTETDMEDRRKIHLRLTSSGRKISEKLEAYREEFFHKLLQGVTKDEMDKIEQILEKMKNNLEEIIEGSNKDERS